MEVYDLKVEFMDGTCLTINNVMKYEYNTNMQMFQVIKNKFIQFIPRENVKIIARLWDLED